MHPWHYLSTFAGLHPSSYRDFSGCRARRGDCFRCPTLLLSRSFRVARACLALHWRLGVNRWRGPRPVTDQHANNLRAPLSSILATFMSAMQSSFVHSFVGTLPWRCVLEVFQIALLHAIKWRIVLRALLLSLLAEFCARTLGQNCKFQWSIDCNLSRQAFINPVQVGTGDAAWYIRSLRNMYEQAPHSLFNSVCIWTIYFLVHQMARAILRFGPSLADSLCFMGANVSYNIYMLLTATPNIVRNLVLTGINIAGGAWAALVQKFINVLFYHIIIIPICVALILEQHAHVNDIMALYTIMFEHRRFRCLYVEVNTDTVVRDLAAFVAGQ